VQKFILLFLFLFFAGFTIHAQELDFPRTNLADTPSLARTIPELARQVIPLYQEPDRVKYLNTLFRLQLAAGRNEEAISTLKALKELRLQTLPSSVWALLPFEILARAVARQQPGGFSPETLFNEEFQRAFNGLNDLDAVEAQYWFGGNLPQIREDLRQVVEKQKSADRISLSDAVNLIRKYQFCQDFQFWTPLVGNLIASDDARRFTIDRDILVTTTDGAHVAALGVRPKSAKTPLPTLLVFTIYADDDRELTEAKRMAAHGYAGMVAYSRGKGRSPDAPAPYEHDGKDARAVIDWITKQSWSDRRVGMYGGSYNGFAQWAAMKHPHPALKTIVPYVAAIPGLGLPMENNIFLNANYGWAFYVTNKKFLDNETYGNRGRWDSLNDRWYESGKPYREFDGVDGTPNPWLQRWLKHPDYDRYWQAMVPYKEDFSKIDIPVLTITGYYDDGQISALNYFREHYKYNKKANHYLLIGPYDHFGSQSPRKDSVLRGYAIDPVAQINTPEITFQWMDFIFKGGRKPDLLADRINYQVMGANEWRHAPTVEKMKSDTLTLYLTETKAGENHRLSKEKPPQPGFLSQEVDLADRKTTNNDYYPWPIVGKNPDVSNGFTFISEPFESPVEISGFINGQIEMIINKKDMDLGLVFYEVTPNGELFHLSYFLGRASYARDMSRRTLLTPDKVEFFPFERTRMVSRRLSKGSRLLVTLNVNKNPYAQINYGTGRDVSDENIGDAKVPLKIKWLNSSYVNIPIFRR
jgi:uncharacterized protein